MSVHTNQGFWIIGDLAAYFEGRRDFEQTLKALKDNEAPRWLIHGLCDYADNVGERKLLGKANK